VGLPPPLGLDIPPWLVEIDGFGHRWGRNGEFYVSVALLPELLAYWLIVF